MPCTNAAAAVADYVEALGEQDVQALMDQLRTTSDQVKNGNLQSCKAMLVGQAHALQSIFMNLSRKMKIPSSNRQPELQIFSR